ncbi:aspartyl/asparaginyl beta-hydroxylase domain-containing protein [Pedobacter nototheniae]|uniref:aspartyl/asparaginyl beta-hydroxylase domain-containing protein n=1 Tax=Pedobacter nototheniae TaxID=2488994 RepID=UPI00292E2B53|nr:aspartyl/asparaginyl beta-hydroxylase domain-containing protein [Pedobacter nototheniae]
MLKFIHFNESYQVATLVQEFETCLEKNWQDHFNQKDYNGSWQSIALRSASGIETDIYANYNTSGYKDTPLLQGLPYIKSILDSWQCEKEAVRLLALHPGSEIKPHRDMGCGYKYGTFRLHVPIITNDLVIFNVGENSLKLLPGACWYIDFNETHSIRNNGNTVRVHLVIDCLRNEWTDQLFSANGYNIKEENEQKFDDATKLLIIQELERMNSDAAKKLIIEIKNS